MGISFFCHFVCHMADSHFYLVDEIGLSGESRHLAPSHWEASHMPRVGFEPGEWLETLATC